MFSGSEASCRIDLETCEGVCRKGGWYGWSHDHGMTAPGAMDCVIGFGKVEARHWILGQKKVARLTAVTKTWVDGYG